MIKKANKIAYIVTFIILSLIIAVCQKIFNVSFNKDTLNILHIEGYSKGRIPYCKVKVGDQIISAKIDLGSSEFLSLPQNVIHAAGGKFLPTINASYGISGNKYLTNMYQIDKVTIDNLVFTPDCVRENNPALEKQMTMHDAEPEKVETLGRIGWNLFKDYVLLFDDKNRQICLSHNVDTFQKHGYSLDHFTATSFTLDRHVIEFDALSDSGIIRCILDTGSSYNLCNLATKENQVEQMSFDIKDYFDSAVFQIGDKNFGPITFNRIYTPLIFQAIIGMEFFEDNLVIVDFKNKMLYFCAYPEDSSKANAT